jgi:hypothetical protein
MRSRYKRETIYAFRHTYITHCKLKLEIQNFAHEMLFGVTNLICLGYPNAFKIFGFWFVIRNPDLGPGRQTSLRKKGKKPLPLPGGFK